MYHLFCLYEKYDIWKQIVMYLNMYINFGEESVRVSSIWMLIWVRIIIGQVVYGSLIWVGKTTASSI